MDVTGDDGSGRLSGAGTSGDESEEEQVLAVVTSGQLSETILEAIDQAEKASADTQASDATGPTRAERMEMLLAADHSAEVRAMCGTHGRM